MDAILKGVIRRKRINYGFISGHVGRDFYFHRSGCARGVEWDKLEEGEHVEFTIFNGERGERAIEVRPCQSQS